MMTSTTLTEDLQLEDLGTDTEMYSSSAACRAYLS